MMDRKNELKQQYKEIEVEAGVFQIKNTENDKIFIGSTMNLKTINGIKFMLETNAYTPNKKLQTEWNKFGGEMFTFHVLEKLKKKPDATFYNKEALQELEAKWCDHLQPYDERGYHQK